jgi:NosR/NirI family nitrous oxide reductase transcriptional regulator
MRGNRLERILAIISLTLVITAGVLGVRREAQEVHNYLNGIIPEGHSALALGGECFALYAADSLSPDSYLINETSPAYGGEMVVSVLVDTTGVIRDLKVARHRETPSFLEKTERKALRKSLIGKSYDDPFVIGADVDVVSGATYTSQAIISCAQLGSGRIARDQLKFEVAPPEAPGLEIGIPEIALLVLYVLALIGIYKLTRFKKTLRWITMLGGLFILGFWFSMPLTLSKLNTFLLGYLPDWHTQLYWYLMIGGFVLSIVITRKNIYCNWICPLGGLQECLGTIGGAKPRFSRRFNGIMKWVQRGVALLAILLALYFRNPVQLNYEIFGVALSLTGATYLFILTGIFIVASVFIKRPWCNYLCPVVPVEDVLRLLSKKKNS